MAEYKDNGNISGLDMKPTIHWYEANKYQLLQHLPKPLNEPIPYEIENPDNIQLSKGYLSGLISLFPQNAKERSILRKIVGQPETWFHKDSTQQQQIPTTTIDDALSPTAIIPGFTYPDWSNKEDPKADIWLYKISDTACSPEVRKIILSESFIHEGLGHTLVLPITHGDEFELTLPYGKNVVSFDYLMEFVDMAEQHMPISHYASTYRDKDNKFPSDADTYLKAIGEELSETISAYLLGFAFGNDEQRSMNPFADRPEIKKFVEDFLNAELVSKSQ